MHAIFREAGLRAHEERLMVVGRILGHGRTTSSPLTTSEVSTFIGTCKTWIADQEYPIARRFNGILNEAALTEVEQQDL
jgi:hypothetical protein